MIYTNIIKIFVTEISVTPGRNNFINNKSTFMDKIIYQKYEQDIRFNQSL